MRSQRLAIIEYLRAEGRVEPAALARAEAVAAKTRQPVEQVLNQLGGLSDEALVQAYAEVLEVAIWDPVRLPALKDLAQIGLSVEFLRRSRLLVLEGEGDKLVCAGCDPLDAEALQGLRFATGRPVEMLVTSPGDWRRAFDEAFDAHSPAMDTVDERRLEREIDLVADGAGEGAGARFVSSVFEAAIEAGASDIHFEPRRHDLCVRFRVDGRMSVHRIAPADLAQPAVSRVKVIANLDLGERRLPQDGRTTFVIGGKPIDVRVATSPTVFGESAVLRILDRTSVPLDLNALSLNPTVVGLLKKAALASHGLFLVTGPTGSGKTTTLYALLQTFAGSPKKVLSVEDPVEYHFEHVSQTQVAPNVGLSFAQALRSFLRQDPDVILVGEIRDPETAAVAIQAAMTGHLVLASIHANDALGVLPRLQDMGIEPYQLAAGFRGAVAQRLVRRLCPDCARKVEATEADTSFFKSFGADPPSHCAEPVGCPKCKGTGFKGRITVSEGFGATEGLLRAITHPEGNHGLVTEARLGGLRTMVMDGLDQIASGMTTREEVAAAIYG